MAKQHEVEIFEDTHLRVEQEHKNPWFSSEDLKAHILRWNKREEFSKIKQAVDRFILAKILGTGAQEVHIDALVASSNALLRRMNTPESQ